MNGDSVNILLVGPPHSHTCKRLTALIEGGRVPAGYPEVKVFNALWLDDIPAVMGGSKIHLLYLDRRGFQCPEHNYAVTPFKRLEMAQAHLLKMERYYMSCEGGKFSKEEVDERLEYSRFLVGHCLKNIKWRDGLSDSDAKEAGFRVGRAVVKIIYGRPYSVMVEHTINDQLAESLPIKNWGGGFMDDGCDCLANGILSHSICELEGSVTVPEEGEALENSEHRFIRMVTIRVSKRVYK